MLLQRALRTSLMLVLLGGFASLPFPFASTARSQSPQETAIGADALARISHTG